MIGMKEAVAKAVEYAEIALGNTRTTGVLLEEIRSDEVKGHDAWLITISIPKPQSAIAALTARDPRDYKTIVVNKDTGEFVELTIRTPLASQ